MFSLVDVHCHLEADEFADILPEVVEGARTAGIRTMITAATTPQEWAHSQRLAQSYPSIEFACGIHPWFVQEGDDGKTTALAQICHKGAVAVGEIGLDGKIDVPMPLQQTVFEAQLQLAKELMLPVVVHCRGAFNELLFSLKRVGVGERGGMLHAFSGSVELAEALMDYNFSFSMGGALSYRRSAKRVRVLKRIYPAHFLLETDSPDMPPVQVERPNRPEHIVYNLAGAAALLECSTEEIAKNTTANAIRLFALGA